MKERYTIAIAGTGYVGLSNAILLAQHHKVYAVDIMPEKVELINQKKSPIIDKEIEEYLAKHELDLTATTDDRMAYQEADFVIISTPTNYDPVKNYFDKRMSARGSDGSEIDGTCRLYDKNEREIWSGQTDVLP